VRTVRRDPDRPQPPKISERSDEAGISVGKKHHGAGPTHRLLVGRLKWHARPHQRPWYEGSTGLIYAGQTGATFWPSGKGSQATLGGRIGGNHLNGSVAGSTFRLTLAGVLTTTLGLRPVGAKRLDQDSESS
jgi:hypothetical protein